MRPWLMVLDCALLYIAQVVLTLARDVTILNPGISRAVTR